MNPNLNNLTNYTKEEKLAAIKMVDYVILADDTVADGEMDFLTHLMNSLSFDSFFVGEARSLKKQDAIATLNEMSLEKKQTLALLLNSVASSDGFVHKNESSLIEETLGLIGLRN